MQRHELTLVYLIFHAYHSFTLGYIDATHILKRHLLNLVSRGGIFIMVAIDMNAIAIDVTIDVCILDRVVSTVYDAIVRADVRCDRS